MAETHLEDLTDRIKPRAASNLLLWGVVGFVLVFFVWAAFAELDRTVRGMGRVIPSSQLQIVSALEAGIVEQIFVRSGQRVRANDPLLLLDPTQSGAELGSGSAALSALEARAARLEAEVAGRAPVFPAPRDDMMRDQIRIEEALYRARASALAGLTGAASARLSGAERAVAEAQAAYRARTANRDARQAEARILRPLVERGIEPRLSLIQAEGAAAIAASEAAGAAASIARASTELATTQAELAARRRALPALAERVQRTTLRAPLSGTVNRVLVTTRGSAIQPSQPLVEIVPSQESLLIEVRIRPQDIASVRMGQLARVAITAYDRAVYGTLEARVVAISPDAVSEERTGETYYVVRVRTDANALRDRQGRSFPIGPGMIAEADLLGDRRTVLQYILSPLSRLSERAFRE